MLAATVPATITLAQTREYSRVALVNVAKKLKQPVPDFNVGKCGLVKGHPNKGSCSFVNTVPQTKGTRHSMTCAGSIVITHLKDGRFFAHFNIRFCIT